MNQAVRPRSVRMKRMTQRGASLIMVMIILTIVSLLGIGAIQISMMSERGARNDRDMQLALQSAEAALTDAELDISNSSSLRYSVFGPIVNFQAFIDKCGTTGVTQGLCADTVSGKPAWQDISLNFADTTATARTTAYGTFTNRTFPAGGAGVQPAQAPRYIIELMQDKSDLNAGANANPKYVYRVTAVGFGPRTDIQAVVQMLYRP